MTLARAVASGSVSVTGLALTSGAAFSYVDTGPVEFATLTLTVVGALVGVALVGAGWLLYRSDVDTRHTVRVAGWNLLGIVVLGLVLVLATLSPGPRLPGYVVVDVLGVSSVAHVLIGYNDVRRIRAEELARQREKLAVVNRLVRHNIRNETQLLTSYAGQLLDDLEDPVARDLVTKIQATASDLSALHERLQAFQRALDETDPSRTLSLDSAVRDAVDSYREDYPDGTFEVDVPEELLVVADDQLRTAIDHLVENALVHGSEDDPFVRVTAGKQGELVTLAVSDRGPGLPDQELAVISGERPPSQLEHASGLGLWVVRAIAERYGGEMRIENAVDGAGTTVTLRFEAA